MCDVGIGLATAGVLIVGQFCCPFDLNLSLDALDFVLVRCCLGFVVCCSCCFGLMSGDGLG